MQILPLLTFYILHLLGNPPAPLATAQDAGSPGYQDLTLGGLAAEGGMHRQFH